jgi:hypothetical protein
MDTTLNKSRKMNTPQHNYNVIIMYYDLGRPMTLCDKPEGRGFDSR